MRLSWIASSKFVVALISAVMVAVLAIGVIGLYYAEGQLVDRTGQALSLTAADIAHKLDLVLFERYGDVQVMTEAIASSPNDPDRILGYLSALKRAYPVYLWLGVTDAQGRITVATDPATVGVQLNAMWPSLLRKSETGQAGDVVPNIVAAGGVDAVAFTAPIRGTQGETLGFVSTRVALPALEEVVTRTLHEFQRSHGLPGAIEYQILTRRGDAFIDSALSFTGNPNPVDKGLPSTRLSESGQPGYVEETHVHRRVPVVTGYAQTQGTGQFEGPQWRVLVRMDKRDVMAPVRTVLRKLGPVVAFVTAPLLLALIWTSRRLADERAQARIRERAVAATSKGMFVTDARRPHHPILFANPAFLLLTRYMADEVLGLSPSFLAGPDTDPVAADKLAAALREGRPCRTIIRHYRKDGTSFWNEVTLSPVRNDRGTVTEFIWVLTDVSDRHEMEQAMRTSEARLRTLASQVPVGIFTTDLQGNYLYVNERWCELAGLTPQEASGQGWAHAVHPDDRARVLEAWSHSTREGGAFCADFKFQRPDGQVSWLHGQATALHNHADEVTGYIGTVTDVTERKRAEDERARLEAQVRHFQKMEAMGALAGGIAHEFNNSLTAILGFSELALPKIPSDSKAHAQIEQVVVAGRRARELVCQLLTFSRQTEQTKRPLSLHLLLKEALKLLKPTLPGTIELCERVATATAPVSADPAQIHQALLNLWTNAEQAMRMTGGALDIWLDDVSISPEDHTGPDMPAPGRYVRLTVKNTSRRLDFDGKNRGIDPFFTTKPVGQGTGMGLAVVHGIVIGHGGTLRIEGCTGQSTTVEMYLPALPVHEPVAVTTEEPLPRGHECILFVEDDESLARLGCEMLDSLGYHVVVRAHPQDALRAFRSAPQRFDLVIAAQTMLNVTGEALTHELLKIRPDLPILLCSDSLRTVPADWGSQAGICGCLGRPLVRKDVAFAVRRVLDGPVRTNGRASLNGRSLVVQEVEELDAIHTGG